jgi:pimeloyl-ACP methyl ester carboxylesterase
MTIALEHHAAHANGVRLHYVRAGKGDPVVLLHGFPQTWYMWRKIIPGLARHYTVIAPDLRGFGESSKPIGGFGFEKVFLVGHDLGGPTAYAYASAHPEEVRRLVLLDIAITLERAEALEYYARLFHLSFHAEPDIAVALVAGRERTYLTHFYRNCYNPGAFSHADIDEYVAAFSAPGALRASMAHYGALWTDLEHNRENAKTLLEMPVLALGGALSFGEGAVKAARRIAKDVRGRAMPRCAHWIAEEEPEALLAELLAFFGEEHAAGAPPSC